MLSRYKWRRYGILYESPFGPPLPHLAPMCYSHLPLLRVPPQLGYPCPNSSWSWEPRGHVMWILLDTPVWIHFLTMLFVDKFSKLLGYLILKILGSEWKNNQETNASKKLNVKWLKTWLIICTRYQWDHTLGFSATFLQSSSIMGCLWLISKIRWPVKVRALSVSTNTWASITLSMLDDHPCLWGNHHTRCVY